VSEGPKKMKAIVGEGKLRVYAIAVVPDQGVIVHLLGGEVSHVGAVALGIPRPSLQDPARLSATSSVITVVGHKEDEIAKPLADEIARTIGRTAVVVAGIHAEGASPEEVATLAANAWEAARRLLAKLGKEVSPDKELS